MECSIAVNCFLFEVAEKVILYLFFIQDVLASWLLLLQLENSFHLVLHACCIPVTAEMKMLRCSSKHSSSKKKTSPSPPPRKPNSKSNKQIVKESSREDTVACGCHKLMSPEVRPFSTIFSSASSSGVPIRTSPSWGCYLSVYFGNVTTFFSAPGNSVKSRKKKLRYAWSAVFESSGSVTCGFLC